MKRMLKRTLGLFLSILMVVSVCLVGLTSIVSAAETVTYKDLGVFSGTGASAGNVVDDPAGSGEKVLKMQYGPGRYNLRLADPANKAAAFVITAGTTYTVTFDYYVDKFGSAGKTNPGFSLYYGNEDSGGDGRKEIAAQLNQGAKFGADKTWHSAAITFTASDIKGSKGNLLKNVYLTYYDSNGMVGYIKNLTIVTEGGTYSNETIDWDKSFNSEGAFDTYGSATSAFTSKKLDADGNMTVVAGKTNTPAAVNAAAWSNVIVPMYSRSDDSTRAPFYIDPNKTYAVTVRYKVDKYVSASWIGIGTSNNDTESMSPVIGEGSRRTYCWAKSENVAVTDGWESITGIIKDVPAQTFLKILVCGKDDTTVTIADVEVAVIEDSMTNATMVTYNDNGQPFVRAKYIGTDVDEVGRNSDNAAMGEKFMGWYTDAQYVTAATKISANSVFYAKYPTTIIDFKHMPSPTSPMGYNGTSGVKVGYQKGIYNITFANNVGAMIPAYDAAQTRDVFYRLTQGVNYKITYYYQASTDMQLRHTLASGAGNSGGRDTSREHGTLTVPATGTSTGGYNPDQFVALSFNVKGNVTSDKTGLCLRGNKSASFRLDKITITEITQENFENNGLKVSAKLNYNDGATANETVEFGYNEIVEFPIPEREGYVFAGWFKNYRLANSAVSTDDIPISIIRGSWGLKDVTYTAKWVSNETVRVDFSETPYIGTMSGGDKGGAFSIVTDEAIDAESTDNAYAMLNAPSANNIYKVSLFNDDGSRLYAMEGVTYRFTIRYKVTNDKNGQNLSIGVGRSLINAYAPVALDDVDETMSVVAKSKNTDGFVTATADFAVKNMYDAGNGVTESGFGKLRQQLCLRINTGVVYVDYVEVTPVAYTPEYALYVDNADVDVDFQNKTFTITPHEGYEIKVGSVASRVNYSDYTITPAHTDENGKAVRETCTAEEKVVTKYYELNSLDNGNTYAFSLDGIAPDRINSLVFTAEVVESGTANNACVIGVSTRKDGEIVNGEEKKAGIRFRGRVSNATVENADEVGFIVIPTKALAGGTIEAFMKANPDSKVPAKGVVYSSERHIVYSQIDGYNDYQIVISNMPEALREIELSIAMYIKNGDNTEYMQLGATAKYSDYVK